MVAGIDLQPMAPIEGVIQVQGDITNARAGEVVRWIDQRIDQCSGRATSPILLLVLL